MGRSIFHHREKLQTSAEKLATAIILDEQKTAEEIIRSHPELRDQSLSGDKPVNSFYEPGSYTPLTFAITHGRYGILAMLCRNGADPNWPDAKGRLPATMVMEEKGDGKMVRILGAYGADFDAKDFSGHCARVKAWTHMFRKSLVEEIRRIDLRREMAAPEVNYLELPRSAKAVSV